MRHLCLFFMIHIFARNGECAERTTKVDDVIYFMPDASTLPQARPITAAEIQQYYLQLQTQKKNPIQNSGNIGANPQYSTTIQPSESEYGLNGQYYTTNKYPTQGSGNAGVKVEVAGYRETTSRPTAEYQPQHPATIKPSEPVLNLNTQYYTDYNRVTDQYTPLSERPVQYPDDQYTSTNRPVSNFPDKIFTQASIVPSGGVNVSGAIGQFGLEMLQVVKQQNNLVVSPYSITALLALLQQGALGETQQQISSVLQMPADVAAKEYKKLTNALNRRNMKHNILKIANGLFVSNSFRLNSDFKSKAIDNFDCEVTPLNFFDSNGATKTINKWVSKATNNRIDQLLSPESLSGNTQLVLVNALLFKGIWQMKFRPETTLPRDFNVDGQSSKRVDFLRARRYYRYGEDKASHLQSIVLPFENQEYSLIVLLPFRTSSVNEILRSVTYAKLAEYLNNTPQDVELELPKFSVRSDIDLQPVLREMGVTKIFGSTAELLGIVDGGNNAPEVSSAVHSAMLSIDEEGGTAAAATAFTVVALSYSSPDAVFKADRPFLAVLWDTKQALPLIMAKITDPTL